MIAVLGMVFCPQIIIDGWSTLTLVSPTPSAKYYQSPAYTCLQCLAWFFVVKSSMTEVYTRLGDAHTLQKILPWPGPHMLTMPGVGFVLKSLLTDGLHSPW